MGEPKRSGKDAVTMTTRSGLPVESLYTPDSMGHLSYEQEIGRPGEFPYTRGIYPGMYRSRIWTMRQYAGFGTPEDANVRFKDLLAHGETGLSVAFDLPTQLGLDSDDPVAEDEVGRVGVAIDSLADFELLFHDIALDSISTSFTINATAPITLAMYLAVAEKQGVSWGRVRGTIQNDILKEYVARGTWIFPPEPSLRLTVDVIEFCTQCVPHFNPISIAGAHFRDAGATAVQELAFALADGITYVEEALKRGLDIDAFAPQLSFFFYTHSDFFEEIAKYRAGRKLWAKIMRERFHAQSPDSWRLRIGVACGGSTLTAQQPENNIVRIAYEAMASALGGVQSMFTAAWDEAFTIPSAETAHLALRTQQVLAEETGIDRTVDPLAGSYFVESLTDRFEKATSALLQWVEEMGGMVNAIEGGVIQKAIAQKAYDHEIALKTGQRTVVGVNKYQVPEVRDIRPYQPGAETLQKQIERLEAVRTCRNETVVRQCLTQLRQAATGSENVMGPLASAVKAYATVGEITKTLEEVWGHFREPAF